MAARVLGAHPGLRPFEVKTALHLSADQRQEGGCMTGATELRAAVAAGVLAAARGRAPLLQSVADVARAIFGARASSIMLFDAASAELVFEAVSGRGLRAARPAAARRTPASPAGCSARASRS